jgi:hypothetical protein
MCSTASSAEPRSLELLEREICELAGHLAAATCRWLLLIAEFDELEGWASQGSLSCAHWLSWRCSLSPGAAREHVRVARRLRELPLVRARFERGELSYCKVRALTRVAAPETEAALVEMACHATGAQLEVLVRGYGRALAATLDAAERQHALRYLSCNWDDDGSLRIQGRLPADEGALLLAAIEAAEASDLQDAEPTEERILEDSAGARRADALASIARASLAADTDGAGVADRCEIVVHVDAESLAGDEVRSCSEIRGGPSLPPETVRRLGCDAAIVGIVERDGKPLSVGRRTRTIPPALRRALRSRDQGCRFPGCQHTRFVHAHHIQHWARGGPTALDNLVQLCPRHHRLVHEGGFSVECAEDGIRFRRPDGRVILTAPRCRPSGPTLDVRNRARGIDVHSRTCTPPYPGDRIDYGIAVEGLLALAVPDG